VYFGYPQAHEDDAVRAVRAALEMVEQVSAIGPSGREGHRTPEAEPLPAKLSVRIGIHSGPVVVGRSGSRGRNEQLAVGDAVNLAARIQEAAGRDTVVVSEATHRLLRGQFECSNLGAQRMKGFAEAVLLHRVLRLIRPQEPGEIPESRGAAPFVGRQQEIDLLLDRWAHVKEGRGQIVFVSGEPGIGKSRLLHEVRGHLGNETHRWITCRCSAFTQNSALYPVIDVLHRTLHAEATGGLDAYGSRLEKMLAESGLPVSETLPLFSALLSLPLPEGFAPLDLSPEMQRRQTLRAIVGWLLSLARSTPLAFAVEDLHWADPSLLELLGMLVERAAVEPLMVLLTSRPEFRAPWPTRSQYTAVVLTRLMRKQVADMAERVAGRMRLSDHVVQQIAIKSDGVPCSSKS
jgi:hypothetical protein